MDKIFKTFRPTIKSINEEKMTAEVVISTKQIDRDMEIIEPASLKKRLKTYKAHPVLLSSHTYNDLRKQIGMAKSIKVNDTDVIATFEWFAGKGNPEADWAWFLIKQGVGAFSIGFLAHDWEDKDPQIDKVFRVYKDIELMEVSQVLIPSNRGAVQAGLESEDATHKELCEMAVKSINWKDLEEKLSEEKPEEGGDDDNKTDDQENKEGSDEKEDPKPEGEDPKETTDEEPDPEKPSDQQSEENKDDEIKQLKEELEKTKKRLEDLEKSLGVDLKETIAETIKEMRAEDVYKEILFGDPGEEATKGNQFQEVVDQIKSIFK